MENKKLENEIVNQEVKSEDKKQEKRVLKSIKDCSPQDIEKDCIKVTSNMKKIVTKAKGNQASRTYYTITFYLVPGICEKTINLELAEFVNIVRSLNLRIEQAENKNGLSFYSWCRLSQGETLDVQTGESKKYWLAEFIVNRMVRKSVFLKELDVDNMIGEKGINFIHRSGSIENVEGSVEMPIFLDF